MDTEQKFFAAQLVLEQASRVQSSSLYQEYRSWCQRMGYSMQDDKQFKASMLRIEEVSYGRSKAGRHYAGVRYRWGSSAMNEKDSEAGSSDTLF